MRHKALGGNGVKFVGVLALSMSLPYKCASEHKARKFMCNTFMSVLGCEVLCFTCLRSEAVHNIQIYVNDDYEFYHCSPVAS